MACTQILLQDNRVICTQDSTIFLSNQSSSEKFSITEILDGHNARITCIRSFPAKNILPFRNEDKNKENILVTSSRDRTIRLWWKGRSQRCFKGHTAPVTVLSDKLLGYSSEKLLASGAEDGTVRLWSLSSSGQRGRNALRSTFFGHQKPIILLSTAWHNDSILISASMDSKIRVWDATVSSSTRASGCVGMASVCGFPVGMKCFESLCYIASGTSVVAIDLRMMRKVLTAAVHQPKMYSFELLPFKHLICTGGDEKAKLWDVRKAQENPKAIADLDGHIGRVSEVHMDRYKLVTGGRDDFSVKIWEIDTGTPVNSLPCSLLDDSELKVGVSAMAIDGSEIATASLSDDICMVHLRDFSRSFLPILSHDERATTSKFWNMDFPSYNDPSSPESN